MKTFWLVRDEHRSTVGSTEQGGNRKAVEGRGLRTAAQWKPLFDALAPFEETR